MKISVVSFSRAGAAKSLELAELLQKQNHQAVSYSWHKFTGRKLFPFQSIKLLFRDIWNSQEVILLLWDMQHVLQSLTPYLKPKREGPALVLMDEGGKYVILLTAGRQQGIEGWCGWFAKLTEAVPVFTASCLREERFTADLFARKNGLHVQDIFRLQNVAAALAAGRPVGIYSDYPIDGVLPEGLVCVGEVMRSGCLPIEEEVTKEQPAAAGVQTAKEPPAAAGAQTAREASVAAKTQAAKEQIPEVGISVTDDWEAPHFAKECRMMPRNLVLGAVCGSDTAPEELERFVYGLLADAHLSRARICAVYTGQHLQKAEAVTALAKRLDVPLLFCDTGHDPAETMQPGETQSCEICESCARTGSENGKRLAGRGKGHLAAVVREKTPALHF